MMKYFTLPLVGQNFAPFPRASMNKADRYYKENLKAVLNEGTRDLNPRPRYKDGTPAYSYFIPQVFESYNIAEGEFPITTLRSTAVLTGIKEILWIYQKQTSRLSDAHELGVKWWDEWDIGDGTIGQRYGATVRKHDLMNRLLNGLKSDPYSRRHIMNLYQEEDLRSPGLNPCAYETIWTVRREHLDMTLIQRSNDYIMAGYINKIQYVALQMMVANEVGLKAGQFCHLTQNLHVYDRHLDAAREILERPHQMKQPLMVLKPDIGFYDVTIDDFIVCGNKADKLNSPLEIAI